MDDAAISNSPRDARQTFIFGDEFFSNVVEITRAAIQRRIARTSTPPSDPRYRAQYIFQTFLYRCEILIAKYSRGDDIQELPLMLPELVDAWEWARREELKVFSDAEMHRRHGFDVNLDAYSLALWMVAFFICFEATETPLFDRLLALIGNEGKDLLFERIVSVRRSGRRPATGLLHANPYRPLLDAIDETVLKDRDAMLRRFMKAWYPGMRGTYWHDSHKGKDGGGYFGYWCFEAAAVVRAFGLDDAAIRDDPYYPKDLAAYRPTNAAAT
jgi:hypothetical protein